MGGERRSLCSNVGREVNVAMCVTAKARKEEAKEGKERGREGKGGRGK